MTGQHLPGHVQVFHWPLRSSPPVPPANPACRLRCWPAWTVPAAEAESVLTQVAEYASAVGAEQVVDSSHTGRAAEGDGLRLVHRRPASHDDANAGHLVRPQLRLLRHPAHRDRHPLLQGHRRRRRQAQPHAPPRSRGQPAPPARGRSSAAVARRGRRWLLLGFEHSPGHQVDLSPWIRRPGTGAGCRHSDGSRPEHGARRRTVPGRAVGQAGRLATSRQGHSRRPRSVGQRPHRQAGRPPQSSTSRAACSPTPTCTL